MRERELGKEGEGGGQRETGKRSPTQPPTPTPSHAAISKWCKRNYHYILFLSWGIPFP